MACISRLKTQGKRTMLSIGVTHTCCPAGNSAKDGSDEDSDEDEEGRSEEEEEEEEQRAKKKRKGELCGLLSSAFVLNAFPSKVWLVRLQLSSQYTLLLSVYLSCIELFRMSSVELCGLLSPAFVHNAAL